MQPREIALLAAQRLVIGDAGAQRLALTRGKGTIDS